MPFYRKEAQPYLLEWSCSQRAFDLHPLEPAQPWYPGHDWQPLALGDPEALLSLANELFEVWK